MKITLDKKSITIEEVKEARQLQRDYGEVLDNETLEAMAYRASGQFGKLIKVEVEITKNHHQLTIWATVILEDFDTFTKTSFDVLQADRNEEHIDNFTKIFKRVG